MKKKKQPSRPLSPHLQVYRPQITSILSIAHRISGFGLLFGLVALVGFLYSLAEGRETYKIFLEILKEPAVEFMKYGLVFALCYHFLNGVRHLLWDVGVGLSIRAVFITGWIVIILSILSTLFIGEFI